LRRRFYDERSALRLSLDVARATLANVATLERVVRDATSFVASTRDGRRLQRVVGEFSWLRPNEGSWVDEGPGGMLGAVYYG
jgi:hypothetical protein